MYRIILASESPRRIEIMKQMGIPCDVMPARVEKLPPKTGRKVRSNPCQGLKQDGLPITSKPMMI